MTDRVEMHDRRSADWMTRRDGTSRGGVRNGRDEREDDTVG
jgi:hypothetical protein